MKSWKGGTLKKSFFYIVSSKTTFFHYITVLLTMKNKVLVLLSYVKILLCRGFEPRTKFYVSSKVQINGVIAAAFR